jgi:hypothetical protein
MVDIETSDQVIKDWCSIAAEGVANHEASEMRM